ncbi:MAG: hypothetical protein K9M99_09370 [Candidatus Cloacimonetes bacterium]|nr:hypothetical protein [Candidatus Cloacimonadota bacterium]
MTLSADNSEHIDVMITDFMVVFQSNTPDWSGMEDITFYLDDNVTDQIAREKRSVSKSRISRDIASQIVPVTIQPVNDAPTIQLPDSLSFLYGDSLQINLQNYVFDIEDDSLAYSISGWQQLLGNISDSLLTIWSENYWTGSDTITVTVNDDTRLESSDTMVIHCLPLQEFYGDIDVNGIIDAFDAALILRYVIGIDPGAAAPLPWDEWRIIRADVDGNGEVEAYDSALILQYVVCVIDQFPVEIVNRRKANSVQKDSGNSRQ